MSKLSRQLVTLARQGRGSFKTIADRSGIASRFSERLAKLNIQIRDVKHIKTVHIEKYIYSRQAENISLRTLQNEMSVVRSIMVAAGRHKLADPDHDKLGNQVPGISGVNRDGTKTAITDEKLSAVINHALNKDEGGG